MSAKKKRLIMKQIKKQQREANSMEGTKLYTLLIQCTEFRIAFENWGKVWSPSYTAL